MKTTPAVLGAICLALSAGTALGLSTPTQPLSDYSDTLADLPRHALNTPSPEEARKMIAPRDQYPLETPDGVVEVAELAFHGRLRSRMREQPFYGAESEIDAFAMVDASYEVQPTRTFDERARYARADYGRASLSGASQTSALAEVRKTQQETPSNFVPLEDGIFEVRAAAENAPHQAGPRVERTAANDGQARLIDVSAAVAGGS